MRIKNLYIYLAVGLMAAFSSCEPATVDETVETAYLPYPPMPEPPYKFERNGSSNVELFECQLLNESIEYIYASRMKVAQMSDEENYKQVFELYNEGRSGHSPKKAAAQSSLHVSDRMKVLEDIERWLNKSAEIAGRGKSDIFMWKNREAQKGQTGFVGNSMGDKNAYFVDEKGIVVAEVFRYAMLGAVFLDKVLNFHLDESFWENNGLKKKHEELELPKGKNYTELEHHWDLAYGYYGFWEPLAQGEGIPALKGCDIELFRAFVRGRTALKDYRYDEVSKEIRQIRMLLSKVIAVRAMNLLTGVNTQANLQLYPQYAFLSLSQAYGLIYALQFARMPDGKPCFTYNEVREILDDFTSGGGLWEKERLLAGTDTKGSAMQIAARIGKVMNISLKEIEK